VDTGGVCFDVYNPGLQTFEIEPLDRGKGLSLAVFKPKLKLRGCRMKLAAAAHSFKQSGIYEVTNIQVLMARRIT
jgi:hypothetical protein